MSIIPESQSNGSANGEFVSRFAGVAVEWLLWLLLAVFAYTQTSLFDKPISEYAFGATAWPRTICLAIVLGATGQLLIQIAEIRRNKARSDSGGRIAAGKPSGTRSLLQKIAVFTLPLAYLYFMPGLGFYFSTPIFIALMLLLLEVRSVRAIFSVTLIVYCLALLIFTRLFYVALPIGAYELFYPLNNAIVAIARIGL